MLIPLSKPSITEEDIKSVIETMRSGWLTYGPKNEEFEEMFAKYINVKRVVSLNSCTSALHLALLASGVEEGDEVILPSFTFCASGNAVFHCGAKPIFAEINLDTFNVDPEDIERKITKRTKAIMPVHFAGLPCNMKHIMEIAEDHDLTVVEDAAEACGAEFNGEKVGSFGVGCFSFFPTKNITTGEGGAITTNDGELAERVKVMSGHGIDKSTWARSYTEYPWRRIQRSIGFNFRMTNFQAALGIEQLKRLDLMNEQRRKVAAKMTKRLTEIDCIVSQAVPKGCKHVYQMYTMRIEGIDRDLFLTRLRKKGIGASVHFDPPVHLQPFYMKQFGFKGGEFPITEKVSKTICTLPMFPELTDEQIFTIVSSVEAALQSG